MRTFTASPITKRVQASTRSRRAHPPIGHSRSVFTPIGYHEARSASSPRRAIWLEMMRNGPGNVPAPRKMQIARMCWSPERGAAFSTARTVFSATRSAVCGPRLPGRNPVCPPTLIAFALNGVSTGPGRTTTTRIAARRMNLGAKGHRHRFEREFARGVRTHAAVRKQLP